MKKFVRYITVIVFGMAIAPAAIAEAMQETTQKVYSFGIVPQQSASKLARLWTPIMRYLSEKSGHQLRFETARNIPSFEKNLSISSYDFAYMNPYHFTVFDKNGYQAVSKAKDKKIKGIVVVAKTSPYKNLKDLAGKELAFPSPAAFAASILPRGEFKKAGVKITPKYVSSHDSVYRNVAAGRVSAGGGVMRTFKNAPEEIRQQLKILWTTPGYTPHAFSAHSRIPANVVADIRRAMMQMGGDEQGRKLLDAIKLKGLEQARNKDWDDVRKLKIEQIK